MFAPASLPAASLLPPRCVHTAPSAAKAARSTCRCSRWLVQTAAVAAAPLTAAAAELLGLPREGHATTAAAAAAAAAATAA
eukprot:CAMPEP_0118829850 /NCGR_PEP_ID=MMETSP1162-20130426/25079_1 /TAXON_ID=33656 /ORGANISM="Phaeocystis Sp, Strain CCMP2710" /LENGTH=80 /DNA_ID=CAMNT_0006761091 /DNA_START=168 /DNA_END=407 /DNA_ORIENTATION=+